MEQPPPKERDQQERQISTARLPVPSGTEAYVAADNLARDSADQVRPRYCYVPRRADQLASTDLVIEPVLGLVRVVHTVPITVDADNRAAYVRIAWRDDHGPCQAVGRYPVDQSFLVRVADPADRLRIRRGLDQAAWRRREISGAVARLIAAHLHLGPRSGLYRFAVMGIIHNRLYDELDLVTTNRPVYRPWVAALAKYCLGRADSGPMLGWGPTRPCSVAHEGQANDDSRRRSPIRASQPPLSERRVSSETAKQLIDAAFALGVAANRSADGLRRARSTITSQAHPGSCRTTEVLQGLHPVCHRPAR
jgi:hypothetical protein